MREIKLKAWDIHKKKFIPTDVWQVLPEPAKGAFAVMVEDWEDYKVGEAFFPEYQTLIQFTGLHDNRGTEIYEGDIIRLAQWSPEVYQIGFDRGAFCFYRRKGEWPYNDAKYLEGCRVIGNIYENPELLK